MKFIHSKYFSDSDSVYTAFKLFRHAHFIVAIKRAQRLLLLGNIVKNI